MASAVRTEEVDLIRFPAGRDKIVTEKLNNLPPKPGYDAGKRAFDFLLSLVLLPVLLFPMLVIALLIRLDSSGPAIYRQKRLGKDQKPFTIYKFRTMYQNAEEFGPRWASLDDRRSTRFGRFLRHSHLDELPQLVNILAGQMSFVGPRPERPEFYDIFDTYLDGFRQRTMVRPGLTGLAQVNGGYELLPEEKIVFDLEYIKKRSFGMDFHIILRTFAVVFGHRGVR